MNRSPFHLSWPSKNATRFDLIFSLKEPLTKESHPDSVATNFFSDALLRCTNSKACLIQDGKFLNAYNLTVSDNQRAVFTPVDIENGENKTSFKSHPRRTIFINHYCSTHWNPPAHLIGDGNSSHILDWHSPISCQAHNINYERPCYVYDPKGGLIDLTPWVLSNGSSYSVNTGIFNNTVKKFNLNVCNEAHDHCGPNVSSCYIEGNNTIDSGFNNLTSIKYDSKEKAVLLTTFGQHNEVCPDQRVKTIVRFVCKNKIVSHTQPSLIRSSACEKIIEWQTIHACPMSEIRVPATQSFLKYEPLNINFNLTELTGGKDKVEVTDVNINGTQKTMWLGLGRGLDTSSIKCENKSTMLTTACLVDTDKNVTTRKSEIVGTSGKSYIRLADDRIYLESFAANKTCQTQLQHFNESRQVGTRVEFLCSMTNSDKPTFLGYRDCIYVFEWPSKRMCLESLMVDTPIVNNHVKIEKNNSLVSNRTDVAANKSVSKVTDLKINSEENAKTGHELHKHTMSDALNTTNIVRASEVKFGSATMNVTKEEKATKTEPVPSVKQPVANSTVSSTTPATKRQSDDVNQPKMNKFHKFFMIGLILTSLAAFVVVIFILDKKTRLRIPLSNIRHQVRQAFQPQPMPYTRVDQFNDSLVL